MNINTLNGILRELTPHEKEYFTGTCFHDFDSLPLSERNGILYKKFSVTGRSSSTLHTLSNNMHIKKQSRYQSVPTHVHDWIEINYMYDGVCPQIINGKSLELRKKQLLLIDTDVPHSTGILGTDDIMVSILIEKKFLNSRFFSLFSKDSILSNFLVNCINSNARHDNYILFHSEKNRRIPFFINELLCEMFDPSLNSDDIIMSLFTLIIAELTNVYENDKGSAELNQNKISLIPILRYIEGNYKNCTLKSTADFFNMNPNYLTTMLKQQLGLSYKELVQEQKITTAARLLRNSSMSIAEIANFIGYENIGFFYKKFNEAYNCSPKNFRISGN